MTDVVREEHEQHPPEEADLQITVGPRCVGLGIFFSHGGISVVLSPDAAREAAFGLLDAALLAEQPIAIVRSARRKSAEEQKGNGHEEDAG